MTYEEAIQILKETDVCMKCTKRIPCKSCENFGALLQVVKNEEAKAVIFEHAEKYRWHDMKKNPKDLPKGNWTDDLILAIKDYEGFVSYYAGYYDGEFSTYMRGQWTVFNEDKNVAEIIAWRLLEEPFQRMRSDSNASS